MGMGEQWALEDRIQVLGWIPVVEGLPPAEYGEEGVEIVCQTGLGPRRSRRWRSHGWYDVETGQWHHNWCGGQIIVTHWLRLPPVPEEGE